MMIFLWFLKVSSILDQFKAAGEARFERFTIGTELSLRINLCATSNCWSRISNSCGCWHVERISRKRRVHSWDRARISVVVFASLSVDAEGNIVRPCISRIACPKCLNEDYWFQWDHRYLLSNVHKRPQEKAWKGISLTWTNSGLHHCVLFVWIQFYFVDSIVFRSLMKCDQLFDCRKR